MNGDQIFLKLGLMLVKQGIHWLIQYKIHNEYGIAVVRRKFVVDISKQSLTSTETSKKDDRLTLWSSVQAPIILAYSAGNGIQFLNNIGLSIIGKY